MKRWKLIPIVLCKKFSMKTVSCELIKHRKHETFLYFDFDTEREQKSMKLVPQIRQNPWFFFFFQSRMRKVRFLQRNFPVRLYKCNFSKGLRGRLAVYFDTKFIFFNSCMQIFYFITIFNISFIQNTVFCANLIEEQKRQKKTY